MAYQETLLGLLPPVSYNRTGPGVRHQAQTDGNALDLVHSSATAIAQAADPRSAGNWIAHWERVLGLDPAGKNAQQRISACVAKINETGGLSIPYFTRLAAAAGYIIDITEPQPFRAGINRAGNRIAREDIMWVWWVNVTGADNRITRFRAGMSAAGDALTAFGDAAIETVFKDLKPAFTDVRFTYEE